MSDTPSTKSNERLAPDFLDFITCLNARTVDVVLVGGYAVGVHGAVRATGDIDFLYRRTAENVRRLCAALDEFGAPPAVIDFDTLMTADTVTYFGRPPYRIDLLSDIDGVSFEEVWDGSAILDIHGQAVRVIGLAELRRNKAATGRPKDRQDLEDLPPVADKSGRRRKRQAAGSKASGFGRSARKSSGKAARTARKRQPKKPPRDGRAARRSRGG